MIAADTNLIAYLCISGENTILAEAVFQADPDWVTPPLWRSEFLNVLSKYIRTGRFNVDEALECWMLAQSQVNEMQNPSEKDVLNLVSSSKLSSYDCEFVALAQQMSIPLITFDKKVLAAFPDVAMSAEKFVARN